MCLPLLILVAPASAARRGRPTRPQSRKLQPRRGPPCKDCSPPLTSNPSTARAAQLVAAGRVGAARPLLAAAKRLSPGSACLADLSARLALRANDPDAAKLELDAAVAADPGTPRPAHAARRVAPSGRRHRGCRARRRRSRRARPFRSRRQGSAGCLAAGARTAPSTPSRASPRQSRPIPPTPASPRAWPPRTKWRRDPDAALAVLLRNIEAAPSLVDQRNAAILLCVRRRDFRQADPAGGRRPARRHRRRLLLRPAGACAVQPRPACRGCGRLCRGPEAGSGRSLCAPSGSRGGCRCLARRARRPSICARCSTATPTGSNRTCCRSATACPACFARRCCATRASRWASKWVRWLDLGCGTGLVALAIADLPVGPLIGVDVAPRMLAQAGKKGIYAELHEADVMQFLLRGGRSALPPDPRRGRALLLRRARRSVHRRPRRHEPGRLAGGFRRGAVARPRRHDPGRHQRRLGAATPGPLRPQSRPISVPLPAMRASSCCASTARPCAGRPTPRCPACCSCCSGCA